MSQSEEPKHSGVPPTVVLQGGLGGHNIECSEVSVGSCEQDAALGGPGGGQGHQRERCAQKTGISANVTIYRLG